MQDKPMTDDFYPWLRKTKIRGRLTGLLVSLSGLVTITKLAWIREHLPGALSEYLYSPTAMVAIVETLLLAVLAIGFVSEKHLFVNEKWCAEASKAAEQFRWWWQLMWISWACVYLVVSIIEIARIASPLWFEAHALWLAFIRDTANNVNTLLLIACFLIMYEETFPEGRGFQLGRVFKRYAPIVLLAFFAFMGAELASVGLIDDPTIAGPVQSAFAAVAGVAGAAALCLIIGRLESKFVSPPKHIILILYCYAALQPLIAAWSMSDSIQVITLVLWLVLKLILFILVYWFLKSGRALFYFDRMQTLNSKVREDWEQFHVEYILDPDHEPSATLPKQDRTAYEWEVFLSGPMASLRAMGAEQRADFEAHVAKIRGVLEGFKQRVYRAPSPPGDSLPDDALRADSSAIRKSRFFVLLWYHEVASSSLFECGAAYEKGIPTLILTDDVERLPFLLRKYDRVDTRSYVHTVPIADAAQWLTEHWSTFVKRAGLL